MYMYIDKCKFDSKYQNPFIILDIFIIEFKRIDNVPHRTIKISSKIPYESFYLVIRLNLQ